MRRNRRRSGKRRAMRRNGRQTAAQRRASLRNLRKARASRRGLSPNRRRAGKRRMRRNTWANNRPGHRKAAKKGWSRKRRSTKKMRANRARRSMRSRLFGGKKAFRKNQYMATLKAAFTTGALITAGFAGHKVLTSIFCKQVCDRLFGAPESATPPATSGFEMLQPYKNNIAGAVVALAGIGLTNMLVKDVRTKMLITGGMATSFLHTLLVTVLARVSEPTAAMLSGADDATAARLSAMYGLGAGSSILPRYAPIDGMGEYFSEMNGLGEYFSEMSGLGQYTPNPDLMQAAAGYGAISSSNSNHIDPSSDLDRELSIAEAAAGVGQVMEAAAGYGAVQPYEASAGMGRLGEYFSEMNGLGAVASLPSADTWVPGMSNPQIWAGVRPVSSPQSAHAMISAGVLQSPGNQGVFG
jgi:hypothetical protein